MKWFSKSEKELYSKVKVMNEKVYFEDIEKPAKIKLVESAYISYALNGSNVSGEVIINHDDKLTITYSNNVISEASCTYKVVTNANNSEAKLKKSITNGEAYRIKNISEFTLTPQLEIVQTKTSPPPTDFDELESLLRKEGLNGVFIDDNIHKVAISEENISLCVVVSKEAIPGKPARFELIDGLENNKHINNDQFFATYVDETPGVSGYDIYGIEILPEELSFFPEFGLNIMVEDRGLISLKEGRLVFSPYKIDIIEETSVQKTINWEDGLVVYEGDVLIEGDVIEGGQIKCTGNIKITGSAYDSYIFSDGDITIEGNTNQSVVYSGFSKIAAKQVEAYCLKYLEILERIMFEASFAAEDGYNYEEKTKSLELAKSEFTAIKQGIEPFLSLIEQFGCQDIISTYNTFNEVCEEAVKTALNDQSGSEEIRTKMEKFYALISDSKSFLNEDSGALMIGSANSSHLFANKEINVTGSGTFQTMIESNEAVIVKGQCLSTNIVADDHIDIQEYKPSEQNEIKIHMRQRSGFIKVQHLHSDSLLQLGERKYVTPDDETNVLYDSKNFPKTNIHPSI
ncbi:FapA family protein [Bacillus toyonensis]|uniref:FapA family protein n=1 Tax=Bacillus toyonensis TaxID=155322 RepID=UPI002E1BD510|nr:FapA family protein [Bacillus toyonensis]